MAETVDRKALRSFVHHTARGFLVFNEGKVTKGIPVEHLRFLLDSEVVPSGKGDPEPVEPVEPVAVADGAGAVTAVSDGNAPA